MAREKAPHCRGWRPAPGSWEEAVLSWDQQVRPSPPDQPTSPPRAAPEPKSRFDQESGHSVAAGPDERDPR